MRLKIEGYSEDLVEIASYLINVNVKFTYKDNTITTEGLYDEFRQELIAVLKERTPDLQVKELK